MKKKKRKGVKKAREEMNIEKEKVGHQDKSIKEKKRREVKIAWEETEIKEEKVDNIVKEEKVDNIMKEEEDVELTWWWRIYGSDPEKWMRIAKDMMDFMPNTSKEENDPEMEEKHQEAEKKVVEENQAEAPMVNKVDSKVVEETEEEGRPIGHQVKEAWPSTESPQPLGLNPNVSWTSVKSFQPIGQKVKVAWPSMESLQPLEGEMKVVWTSVESFQ
ncbi:uncharacterized protein [Engystomops pustulosus]|uniref:uncharacterized protein n=1 Tax=Engystomops pustulosus TaxID=76066 RepID=UPI003AFA97CB